MDCLSTALSGPTWSSVIHRLEGLAASLTSHKSFRISNTTSKTPAAAAPTPSSCEYPGYLQQRHCKSRR
eukprot:558383-Pelagomonas_calceolata.AAC.1